MHPLLLTAGRATNRGGGGRAGRRAFSLIELLVSVAIIATLIAILSPSLSQARRAGMLAKCMSNMRQVSTASLMYNTDNDGYFPRTMETVSTGFPVTVSWWAIQNYQGALNPYIQTSKGGVGEDGLARGKAGVWFDPADPDAWIPAMWGSFVDNGLITGVARKDTRIPSPSETVYATLRERHWAKVTGNAVPDPLPVSNPDDPFWTSMFFDMCLDPWSTDNDEGGRFHWSKGTAAPPAGLFPDDPDAVAWDRVIDGRCPDLAERRTRYPGGQPYSFCDGHVEVMRFEATYAGPSGNMWDVK